jgi:AcrR family transcriptional regulator
MPPANRVIDRPPLSRERILRAALELADDLGIAGLSMRKVGEALDVEAMSLYNNVANKDDLLDGLVDSVFREIEVDSDAEWRTAMRQRAIAARAAMVRHPWAVGLMDSRRNPGPATLTHHDAVLGSLRNGGFSVELAAHAFALLDSYVYGFAVQETSLPFQSEDELADVGAHILHDAAATHPHLTELYVEHASLPGYAFADEFDWGLELVLDGLERALG